MSALFVRGDEHADTRARIHHQTPAQWNGSQPAPFGVGLLTPDPPKR
jgi:hypothetical protein